MNTDSPDWYKAFMGHVVGFRFRYSYRHLLLISGHDLYLSRPISHSRSAYVSQKVYSIVKNVQRIEFDSLHVFFINQSSVQQDNDPILKRLREFWHQ